MHNPIFDYVLKRSTMLGDRIIIKKIHEDAARIIGLRILSYLEETEKKIAIAISGESGSGKSETAEALSEYFTTNKISNLILSQDDYFVHPPKSNNLIRRNDPSWRGIKEVRLDLMDEHIEAFHNGEVFINKPTIDYKTDTVLLENFNFFDAELIIVEGTYTSLLQKIDKRVFIDLDFRQTLKHRQLRNRDPLELDEFTTDVLKEEHSIISDHKRFADIIINRDYSVEIKNG